MSDEETAVLKEWAKMHDLKDDERFGALGLRVEARMTWLKHLTITNVIGILVFAGSVAAFFITEHDIGVANREAIISVRLAIERLNDNQNADRALDRAEAAADRELASASRQRDRVKSLQNNAEDRAKAAAESKDARVKAQIDRDRDRDDKANRPGARK